MSNISKTMQYYIPNMVRQCVRECLKEEFSTMVEASHVTGCKEAALFLTKSGFKVSLSYIQHLTSQGDIPCRKLHKAYVFNKYELLNWAKGKYNKLKFPID
jgi:hypothetical protein